MQTEGPLLMISGNRPVAGATRQAALALGRLANTQGLPARDHAEAPSKKVLV